MKLIEKHDGKDLVFEINSIKVRIFESIYHNEDFGKYWYYWFKNY